MVEYGKVSTAQIIMTLLVCKVFTVITYTPVYTDKSEITAVFLGGACSTFILLAAAVPIILLMRKTNEDVVSLSYRIHPVFGKAVFLLLFASTMVVSINTLVHFQFFMVNAVFPNVNAWIIVVTMFLAAFYAVFMGMEGLFRTGAIVCLLLALFLVTIGFTLYDRIDLLNLKPLMYDPVKSVLSVAWQDTSKNMELLLFMLLIPNAKGKMSRSVVIYVLATSAMLCLISFLVATVLGEFTFRQIFPFYMIASVVDVEIIRRFDAIHMTIWVLTAFLRTSIFMLAANSLLHRVLPHRLAKWSLPAVGALILGFSLFLSSKLQYNNMIYQFFETGIPLVVLTIILPIILLLFHRKTVPPQTAQKQKEGLQE
ncbi:spore germination protein (amino acid permease) [uncultured Ruminococcus sp.]|nr:spore germination protein (amino acid permease) [uncultured Ruminococcus sp.]SCH76419.1 spore germination protein (amino acid permease) [uncultured Clostridium sp.]